MNETLLITREYNFFTATNVRRMGSNTADVEIGEVLPIFEICRLNDCLFYWDNSMPYHMGVFLITGLLKTRLERKIIKVARVIFWHNGQMIAF